MNLGIIADDFTGANDVALQLSKYGIKVESLIDLKNMPEYFVYSTETRNAKEKDAREKLNITYKMLKTKNVDKIYKKIDSTLRGNIKTEIEVLLENIDLEEKVAVVLPFPKLGRVVKNGKLWIDGVELKDTSFAKDPYWKLESSNVLDYFGGELMSLEELHSENTVSLLENKKSRVLVFEAETNEDLDKISKLLIKQKLDKYLVASAGIMEFMLHNWGFEKEKILVVSGSCNKININQTKLFIEEYKPNIYDYYVDEEKVLFEEGKEGYILRSIRDGEERSSKDIEIIKKAIAQRAKEICEKQKIKKIILSGGDISIAFMEEFGITKLEILSEIETGIGFGTSGDWQLIMKPGGYGSEKIYEKMYSFLKKYR